VSASAILLVIALTLYGLSVALLVVDALRSPGLSPAARAGWAVALVVGNFFAIVLWFAQGRTGRYGRIGSIVLVLAIAVSIAVIVVEAAKIL
jgi:hypothetical protein